MIEALTSQIKSFNLAELWLLIKKIVMNSFPSADQESYFVISSWVIDSLIALSSIIFFYRFCKTKDKNPGLYLIFVLCCSNLILPFIGMISMATPNNIDLTKTLIYVTTAVYQFGLYWSTGIAIFVYKIIKGLKFDLFTFIVRTFISCFSLCLVFPLV